ncbi:hypothetical protein AB0N64_14035 [Microbacterium sp. NPDC089318]
MPSPHGFQHLVRGDEVVILHHGIRAATLRGAKAVDFLSCIDSEDPQPLMARLTGDYRRGNERVARRHPRNVG